MSNERARALELIEADEDLAKRLDIYVALLSRWRSVTNLTSDATMPHVWSRHVADSGQLRLYARNATRWLDFGSGAGFPGLVVAMQIANNPGAIVHLVESDKRKCAFLREVARETSAPAQVHAVRIQSLDVAELSDINALTARALAPPAQLLHLARPWLSLGATCVFPCGQLSEDHASALLNIPGLNVETFNSLVDPRSRIIRVRFAPLGPQ